MNGPESPEFYENKSSLIIDENEQSTTQKFLTLKFDIYFDGKSFTKEEIKEFFIDFSNIKQDEINLGQDDP